MPVPRTCPLCGGPCPTAHYRNLKPRAPRFSTATDPKMTPPKQIVSIGRAYCPRCDYLLPRDGGAAAPLAAR